MWNIIIAFLKSQIDLMKSEKYIYLMHWFDSKLWCAIIFKEEARKLLKQMITIIKITNIHGAVLNVILIIL